MKISAVRICGGDGVRCFSKLWNSWNTAFRKQPLSRSGMISWNMVCADWHHWTTQQVQTMLFFLPFPPSSLILHYTFFLVLQAMLSRILSSAGNFSCHYRILICSVTTNVGVWELMVLCDTERSDWPVRIRAHVQQRTQGRSSGKWTYPDSECKHRTSEDLYCLHFLFLDNCFRYVKYLDLICISIFICHAKAFFLPPLRNQQHLILLPSLSHYKLFAFPQALVTFWKDRKATKALLVCWSCALLCCVRLFGCCF